MADHDQLFKVLLREFFESFFQLFYPQWVPLFDFGSVEWLDKDVFLDPPRGEKRNLDLLARVRTREPVTENDRSLLTLVHIEVESDDKVAPFRPRMYQYYGHLRRIVELPVLPIALYLRVGLDGIGWDVYEERILGEVVVRFRYPYVGLPALNADDYIDRDNLLGVALTALMRVPPERREEIARQAWRRLVQSTVNDYQRHLL
jgi:hypothetical protein